jgi:mycofactocin glycosyltransferase
METSPALAADVMCALWQSVQDNTLTVDELQRRQEDLLAEYRRTWEEAILFERSRTLEESMHRELGTYLGGVSPQDIRERRERARALAIEDWKSRVDPSSRESVERFYEEHDVELYQLMAWHTLSEDLSPLAYVTALKFVQPRACRHCLDFGCGVGSGAVLFARNGFEVSIADISSLLLRFSAWRLASRQLSCRVLDLKVDRLPTATYDLVLAMDVFEHLVDPVGAVDEIARALKPGGFLFGRFHVEEDDTHVTHVVKDFTATLERMRVVGFEEAWRDRWFWGHQVYQKTANGRHAI